MKPDPIPYQAIIIATHHQSHLLSLPDHLWRAIPDKLPKLSEIKVKFPQSYDPTQEAIDHWIYSLENTPPNWIFFRIVNRTNLPPQGDGQFPFPIAAFIVPAVNPSQSMSNRTQFLHEQQGYIGGMAHSIGFFTKADMVVICLRDHHESESCFDENDEEWWQYPNIDGLNASSLERDFQRTNIGPLVKLLNCHIDDLPNLVRRLPTVTNIPIETDIPSVRFILRDIENAEIDYQSLGVGERASIHFVRNVIQSLVPKNIAFRIWFAHKNHPIDDAITDYEIIEMRLRDPYYSIFYEKILLSTPTVKITPYRIQVGHRAHHAYIEFNGMIFDSFVAFNNPIPIDAYQNKLIYHTRRSVDISSEMSLKQVENTFEDLIAEAF